MINHKEEFKISNWDCFMDTFLKVLLGLFKIGHISTNDRLVHM
jgi:hypothetical protein